MTALCNSFKRLALDTWDRLGDARSVEFQLGEETITDLLMLDLKKRHSSEVISKTFSKPVEGENGADWEWWFRDASHWTGFRVQAKILNFLSEKFEHLHYYSEKDGVRTYQSDKLIANALDPTFPKRPLYCLYIHVNNSKRLLTWPCLSYSSTKDFWGSSLINAFTVRGLRPKNKCFLSDVENHMTPWHCLVCCSGYGASSPVATIDNFAAEAFPLDTAVVQEMQLESPQSFLLSRPPEYVLQLLENQNNLEVLAPDADLAGVMIFDCSIKTDI